MAGDEREIKFQSAVKSPSVLASVDIDEVRYVIDAESIPTQEPLVDLQLPFVTVAISEAGRDLRQDTGGLVVDDNQFAAATDPDVIDRAMDYEIGRLMQMTDAGQVLAPLFQVLMLKWDRVESGIDHAWVPFATGAILIKLALEKRVNSVVQRVRCRAGRLDAAAPVEIETARALKKPFELGARQLERLG